MPEGPATICPHDFGTSTPSPGVTYICRLCGAQITTSTGPAALEAIYPAADTPAGVPDSPVALEGS